MKKLMMFFAAGCIGALIHSLVMWQFGQQGVSQSLSVAITPSLSAHWLYPKIVWGGLWGLLFILPMLNSRLLLKGSVLSLFPSIVQLFIIYPFYTHKGFGGLELGLLTPAFILALNWVWGIATALSLRLAR